MAPRGLTARGESGGPRSVLNRPDPFNVRAAALTGCASLLNGLAPRAVPEPGRLRQCLCLGPGLLHDDVPEAHHKNGVLSGVDVAEHVALHRDDIRRLAGLERAHFLLNAEKPG